MKAEIRFGKKSIVIKIDGQCYLTDNELFNNKFYKTSDTFDPKSFSELGDFNSAEEAYEFYVHSKLGASYDFKKKQVEEQKLAELERKNEYENLLKMDVIPATVENLKIILDYLNKQNWGCWKLPKLSIGYSAAQYDCEGKLATTITLDEPISDENYGIKNERKFKVGGRRDHLMKYRKL